MTWLPSYNFNGANKHSKQPAEIKQVAPIGARRPRDMSGRSECLLGRHSSGSRCGRIRPGHLLRSSLNSRALPPTAPAVRTPAGRAEVSPRSRMQMSSLRAVWRADNKWEINRPARKCRRARPGRAGRPSRATCLPPQALPAHDFRPGRGPLMGRGGPDRPAFS